MKIENSVILITGGSAGIGEATAKLMLSLGGIVYICDVQKEKGEQVAKESNGKIKFIQCDVSDENQVEDMINLIYTEQGRIDVVINNAGIAGDFDIGNLTNLSEEFNKVIKINLTGAFLVSKYSVEKMIKNYDINKDCNGVIIHISSIMGNQGVAGSTIYSASKGGLLGMTLPMARDLGRFKIRVNSICPGLIDTAMSGPFKPVLKSVKRSTPIGRLGQPFEIAQAIESVIVNDFINGSFIKVDGGIVANF